VAVSESVRRELADLMAVAPESIWVVPPGVDPASFLRWGEATRHLASDLGLQGADLVLLLPSRVTRRKNIEMAVGIIAALVAAGAGDVQLVVTGPPGPHDAANRAYLDSLAGLAVDLGVAERIHFLSGGRQPSDRGLGDRTVAELFTLADALLFPSRAEGFGIPILEAGLARLPVFCADIPAFRDSGGEEVTYLPLDASPQQAAEVILKTLAADPRHRLRRRVLGAFTWQELVRDRLLPLLMNDSDG
jgi:glycosyltransferase involved in cell wall biosynthesis